MKSGVIFNIQKFSIHDGPGVRTTVFLKGCPLRCRWCANPESQIQNVQVLYDIEKCCGCRQCIQLCPQQAIGWKDGRIQIHAGRCMGCLRCVQGCPQQALTREGESKTVDEIMEICLQDKDFYEESGGGVTISGGEGMVQPQFLKALAGRLRENGLHMAIETTGYVKKEVFRELAVLFDLLLFDVKHYDSARHQEGTGVQNGLIIENLRWAVSQGFEILPRIPVIPGFNAKPEDAEEFSNLLLETRLRKVQLLPFHQMGERKYELLNKDYELKEIKALHPEDLEEYRQIFVKNGVEAFF